MTLEKKEIKLRIEALKRAGLINKSSEVPAGAIPIAESLLVRLSTVRPKGIYVGIRFICRECGKKSIWTAEQQRCYFEEKRGNIYARAVQCDHCRQSGE